MKFWHQKNITWLKKNTLKVKAQLEQHIVEVVTSKKSMLTNVLKQEIKTTYQLSLQH